MYNKNIKTIENEIIRMLQVSNFGSKKPSLKESVTGNRIIKEDFVNDLNNLFNNPEADESNNLSTNGPKYIMSLELKAAMLAHTLSEYQAALLGVYTEWRQKTAGAAAGSTPETIVSKPSVDKLSDLSAEKDRIDSVGKDVNVHTHGKNWNKEWQDIIKSRRVVVTFAGDDVKTKDMSPEEKAQQAKWLERKSYQMISMSGQELTPMGKAQIEFLARAFTMKPADEKEKELFSILNDSGYHYATTAKEVLRQFYSLALIPYIMVLTRRAKYNPNDSQLHEFIEEGVDHALYQMMNGKFDPTRGNVGSFIIQTVKNSVKNQLAEISDYKLDLTAAQEYLMNNQGPFSITSTAPPDEVSDENYVGVKELKQGSVDHQGRRTKSIYAYTYSDAQAVLNDLTRDARSGRKAVDPNSPPDLESDETGDALPTDKSLLPSPLSKRFLTAQAKQMFYKSFPPSYDDIKDSMGLEGSVNPYETEKIFKVEQMPAQAKQQVDAAFSKIIDVWLKNDVEVQSLESPAEFKSNRAIRNRLKVVKQSDIIKELMFDIFNYGEMIEVYTVTWPLKGSKTKIPAGRPVKYVTVNNKQMPAPNIYDEIPKEGETEWIWSTRIGLNDLIKPEFINKFIAKAKAKFSAEPKALTYFVENANDIVNKTLRAIRYYFGYDGVKNPFIRQNMDTIGVLLKNYSSASIANTPWSNNSNK